MTMETEGEENSNEPKDDGKSVEDDANVDNVLGKKGKGRRKKPEHVDVDWYWDHKSSEGGKLKDDGQVILKLHESKKKLANVRCRIETFGEILEGFCETKRRWVREMGFGGLLCMIGKGLPRTLCYWLASWVDAEKKALLTHDGKRFPFSKVQVNWIFGLPLGPKALPNKISQDSMKEEVKELINRYSTVSERGVRGITATTLMNVVKATDISEDEFKCAFLMLALNEVLCPTTCNRFSSKLFPAVLVYKKSQEYDWCSLLLEHLLKYIGNFAKSFYVKGYASGCGGCTMFLAVFYLDRLKRQPIHWGHYPRLEVWTKVEVRKAQAEDLRSSGDFGNLGCIDLAYGEPHPLAARDALTSLTVCASTSVTDETVGMLTRGYYDKQPCRRSKGKKRDPTTSNPYYHRMAKMQRSLPSGSNEENATGSDEGIPVMFTAPGEHLSNAANAVGVENTTVSVQPVVDVNNKGGESDNQNNVSQNLDRSEHAMVSGNYILLNEVSKSNTIDIDNVVANVVRNFPCDSGEKTVSEPFKYLWGHDEGYFGCLSDKYECLNSSLAPSPPLVIGGIFEPQVSNDGSSSWRTKKSYTSIEYEFEEVDSCVIFGTPTGKVDPNNACCTTPSVQAQCNPICAPIETHILSPISARGQKSRRQREIRSSTKISSDYIELWRPRRNRQYKTLLVEYLNQIPGDSVDEVLFECDGLKAGVKTLASVAAHSGPVLLDYVCVAAVVYTKVWESNWTSRSKKIMMDPRFALSVIRNQGDPFFYADRISKQFMSPPEVIRANRINVVFIPVLGEYGNWWAIAFSINRNEIRLLDSTLPVGVDVDCYTDLVTKLTNAMDLLLNFLDPTWPLNSSRTWNFVGNNFGIQSTNVDSGIMMLMSIKTCAVRFRRKFNNALLKDDRAWLLCEDVLSDFNLHAQYVKSLL